MKIVLIGLIYLFTLIQGLHSYKEPISFSWMKSDKIKLLIIYKNGQDVINLKEYNPIPYNSTLETDQDIKSDCNYLGKMEGESDAEVVISGCKNSLKYYVTIFCKNFLNDKFLMNNGSLSIIKSPYNNDMTEDELLTFPPINKTLNSRPKRQAYGFPSKMIMNLVIGFDYSFSMRHGGYAGALRELRRIISISQGHFSHQSLTTRIILNVVYSRYYANKRWKVTRSEMYGLRREVRDRKIHAHAFFTYDPNPGYTGYAFKETVCSFPYADRVSLTKDAGNAPSTADSLCHQLGHNLGMRKDFEFRGSGCTGFMDHGYHPSTWSHCSVNSFRNYFNKIQPWCMRSSNCRNNHSFCETVEMKYQNAWQAICRRYGWIQQNCYKYCRKCL